MGCAVELVSVVGDDVFGSQITSSTLAAGVNTQSVRVVAGSRTASYLALLEPDGSLAWAINDMQILELLTPEILAKQAQDLQNAACWVLDCNLPERTLAWLFGRATSCPVTVDGVSAAKVSRLLPWLGQIDLLKLNRLEAAALTGLAVESLEQAMVTAQVLKAKGVGRVVITMGSLGACWCNAQGRTGYLPVSPNTQEAQADTLGNSNSNSNSNSNGAGDALFAGLLAALGQGRSFDAAMASAMVCAARTRAGFKIDRTTIGL